MTFTVKIKCDNAAFYNEDNEPSAGHEVARILRHLADDLEESDIRGERWRLMDANGNHAGDAKATSR